MGGILSYEKIKEYIEGKDGNGCLLITTISEFEEQKLKQGTSGSKTDIKVKCNCGETFEINFSNFKSKKAQRRCPLCRDNVKWDIYWVNKYVEKFSDCMLMSEEYDKHNGYLKFKCVCGEIFETTLTTFRCGKKCCDKCASINRINNNPNVWSHEEIENYIKNNSKCKIISMDIKNITDRNLILTCEDCGEYFTISFDEFIHSERRRCRRCGYKMNALHRTKSHEDFLNDISNDILNEYEVLEEYKGKDVKIKFKHLKCNRIFEKTPNKFLTGQLCPYCNSYKGENKIIDFLLNNEFLYDTQYKFDDLRGKNKQHLKYDVAVLGNNKELQCLIEYHGKGHYEPIDWAGKGEKWAIKNLEDYQKRDDIKRKYCENHKIKLIEIPYWEFDNIEIILNKKLNKKII